MGFGAIIGGMFAVGLILLAAYIAVSSITSSSESVILSMKNIEDTRLDRMRTSIHLDNVTATSFGLDLNLSNNGDTVIKDMDYMDIIITSTTTRTTRWIPKGTSGEYWTYTLQPDSLNPGYWDPGEEMRIKIYTTLNANWVKISTPNGVSTSGYV